MRRIEIIAVIAGLFSLGGCANFDMDAALKRSPTPVQMARTPEQAQDLREQASRVLREHGAEGLPVDGAIRVMLLSSPQLQALLASHWKDGATAAQTARLANPLLTLERLQHGSSLDIGRLLSVGVVDLLLLPQRLHTAQKAMELVELNLAASVVDQITQVRLAWIRAVAAQQSVNYAQQVVDAADAAATLAQRMQAVGNFNRLERARHHGFYAMAAAQLVQAEQIRLQTREQLIRSLGLNREQIALLRLPARLPDLPAAALGEVEVRQAAQQQRLDVQIAQAQWNMASSQGNAGAVSSWLEADIGARRDSSARGWELAVRLPMLDAGDSRRAALSAQELAATHRLQAVLIEAASTLREDYASYRSAYTLAAHYRDEIVPLRKIVAEENLLRYNGMIIGVFELLADSKEQVQVVMAALQAQERYWLADAQLMTSLLGRPSPTARTALLLPSETNTSGGH